MKPVEQGLTCAGCQFVTGGATGEIDAYGRVIFSHGCGYSGEERPSEYDTYPNPPRMPGCVRNRWFVRELQYTSEEGVGDN